MTRLRQQLIESLIVGLIWLFLILYPIVGSGTGDQTDWDQVLREWIQLIPFFLIFLIHHFLLFPELLLKKRYVLYTVLTLLVVIAVSLLSPLKRYLLDMVDRPIPIPIQPPPEDMPGPWIPGFRDLHPLGLFHSLVISLLLVGFDAAIRFPLSWYRQEREKQQLERDRMGAELAFLRNQISPHFFMNTLNNIHALIDEDGEMAKDSVIRLSKLMRYLLYDADSDRVTLQSEVEFLTSYLDLMKLRYSDKVVFHIQLPEEVPGIHIPPLLTIVFVENAFKHGVSYQNPSEISISMILKNDHLLFDIRNTLHRKDGLTEVAGGVGLSNIKKRLDLLYGDTYTLDIQTTDQLFSVHLMIPYDEAQSTGY